jgi:hypothetical protein
MQLVSDLEIIKDRMEQQPLWRSVRTGGSNINFEQMAALRELMKEALRTKH